MLTLWGGPLTSDGGDVGRIHDVSEPQTLTVPEAARLLGMGRSTLYNKVRADGEVAPGVPALKVGASYRIPKALFMRWLSGESV